MVALLAVGADVASSTVLLTRARHDAFLSIRGPSALDLDTVYQHCRLGSLSRGANLPVAKAVEASDLLVVWSEKTDVGRPTLERDQHRSESVSDLS